MKTERNRITLIIMIFAISMTLRMLRLTATYTSVCFFRTIRQHVQTAFSQKENEIIIYEMYKFSKLKHE